MTDQPKLEGQHEPWEHVAREFADCEPIVATFGEYEGMEAIREASYVGDYVPAEPVCREVVRLRAKLDETEAALREWCEFIGFAGRDFVKRFVEEEMRKRGLWRDPEPKEESDGA
jgi:hypothetical protein